MMRVIKSIMVAMLAVSLAGCQAQNIQAVRDVLDATAQAAERAHARGAVVIETQDAVGYQMAGFGLRPPVKATGTVLYDYRQALGTDTVDTGD